MMSRRLLTAVILLSACSPLVSAEPTSGVVWRGRKGSPAPPGMADGDIVTAIDGVPVRARAGLWHEAGRNYRPRTLTVWRRGKDSFKLSVQLTAIRGGAMTWPETLELYQRHGHQTRLHEARQGAGPQHEGQHERADAIGAGATVAHDLQLALSGSAAKAVHCVGKPIFVESAGEKQGRENCQRGRHEGKQVETGGDPIDEGGA